MTRILMMHGPNHNMFGHRDPNLYGSVTFEDINRMMEQTAADLGVELEIFQSNYEGAFIEKVHEAFYNHTDAVIYNPGGWTNNTIAVKDALDILTCPRIEVHMSNIFRKHGGSVTGQTMVGATGVIIGFNWLAYKMALIAAAELCSENDLNNHTEQKE